MESIGLHPSESYLYALSFETLLCPAVKTA